MDITIKNYHIKTSFVSPEGPKVWANKTGINFMISSYYRLTANCSLISKKYEIKTSFVSLRLLPLGSNKTGLNFSF